MNDAITQKKALNWGKLKILQVFIIAIAMNTMSGCAIMSVERNSEATLDKIGTQGLVQKGNAFYSKNYNISVLPFNDYQSLKIMGPLIPLFPQSTDDFTSSYPFYVYVLIHTQAPKISFNVKKITLEHDGRVVKAINIEGPYSGENENYLPYSDTSEVHIPLSHYSFSRSLNWGCDISPGGISSGFRKIDDHDKCYIISFDIGKVNPKQSFIIHLNGLSINNRPVGKLGFIFSSNFDFYFYYARFQI